MTKSLILTAALALIAGAVQAEEITCQGNITSIQGEGLVARTHRFEVSGITGSDVVAVLDKCRGIARERQSRAARKSPGGTFRQFSDIDLTCSKGAEKFQVRRSIKTGP